MWIYLSYVMISILCTKPNRRKKHCIWKTCNFVSKCGAYHYKNKRSTNCIIKYSQQKEKMLVMNCGTPLKHKAAVCFCDQPGKGPRSLAFHFQTSGVLNRVSTTVLCSLSSLAVSLSLFWLDIFDTGYGKKCKFVCFW